MGFARESHPDTAKLCEAEQPLAGCDCLNPSPCDMTGSRRFSGFERSGEQRIQYPGRTGPPLLRRAGSPGHDLTSALSLRVYNALPAVVNCEALRGHSGVNQSK